MAKTSMRARRRKFSESARWRKLRSIALRPKRSTSESFTASLLTASRCNWASTRRKRRSSSRLLFEAPAKESAKLQELVKEEMEGVYKLAVPIVVEIGVGPNWRDLD